MSALTLSQKRDYVVIVWATLGLLDRKICCVLISNVSVTSIRPNGVIVNISFGLFIVSFAVSCHLKCDAMRLK